MLCLCFLLVTCSVVTASVVVHNVDNVISAGLGCHRTPGLAVAVVRDGNVVFSQGYGVQDLVSRSPVTNMTLFEIASLTKAFTTALLSKVLSDDKRFSINTNVYKILGKHKFNNTLRSVYATVEDLMAHRMGIPRNNYLRLDNTLTRQDLLRRIKYLPSTAAFRDSFYYSDLMYGLLTHITETISGKTWEDVMREKIFTPLHMNSSTFGTRVDFRSKSMATPYITHNGHLQPAATDFIRHWALIGGSGSVVSNAVDMSKWMMFHLSGGKNQEGTQVVSEDLLKETYNPRNALHTRDINAYFRRPKTPVTMSNDGYGLGWKTGYYRGLKLLQHSGSTFGYRSFLSLLPDKKLGVFMAMTGTDDHYWFRGSLSAYLTDVFLGVNPWINNKNICTFPVLSTTKRRRRRTVTKTEKLYKRASEPLVRYAGNFRNEAYGNILIRYDSSSHRLQATYGIASWNLESKGGNTFHARWNKSPPSLSFDFTFRTNGANVYALIPSFESKSPPVFFRVSTHAAIIG